MKIERLAFEGFRNLKTGEIQFDEGVNIIYGDNAQGKTNLLEGLWLFTGNKSFRGNKDAELITFNQTFFNLSLDFFAGRRKQNARIQMNTKRNATLNEVKLTTASALSGHFCAIVFSPDHLSLVKDGPGARRKFIDTAISQLSPRYMARISEYQRLIAQRNALLKDIPRHADLLDTLEIWDDKLCHQGKHIFEARFKYCCRLSKKANEIYTGIANGQETLTISYDCGFNGLCNPNDYAAALKQALINTRGEDIAAGHTTAGVHRDNLEIDINDYPARIFGSQGQQRSAVLSLKMAEASLLQEITGEPPVALLDDVMSELDTMRQDYILNHIKGWQVLITCCDPAPLMRLSSGKIFHVENGIIRTENKQV